MGFLSEGGTLLWQDSVPDAVDVVRDHGVLQFLSIYSALRDRETDNTTWGDEVEYLVVKVDDETQKVTLSLRAGEILAQLMKEEKDAVAAGERLVTLWRPEYGEFMVEGTPGEPYPNAVNALGDVEASMAARRRAVERFLEPGEHILTLTSFPRMGVGHFTTPAHEPRGPNAQSLFVPDECTNHHRRFQTLTHNIRARRQGKVCILVPMLMDRNTVPVSLPKELDLFYELGPLSGMEGDYAVSRSVLQANIHGEPPSADVRKRRCRKVNRLLTPGASPSQIFFSEYLQKYRYDKQHEKSPEHSPVNGSPLANHHGESPTSQKRTKDELKSVVPQIPLPTSAVRGNTAGEQSLEKCCGDDFRRHPSLERTWSASEIPSSKQSFIYMDCMAFGMGCCCLQCTFQTKDITEARDLYDQLGVLCPIMLAVSAATPIFRGYLADMDVRWHVISQSVDDRTPIERGVAFDDSNDDDDDCDCDGLPVHSTADGTGFQERIQLKANPCDNAQDFRKAPKIIPKSRYDSISCYISQNPKLLDEYNDIPLVVDTSKYCKLVSAGLDRRLARHISHLFVRDPLVIYADKVNIDNKLHNDHFENIQSTNWQTVRFKPPPPNSNIGWRVEFRVLECQLTDFENAAFAVFTVLLTRAILHHKLNLYIPISKVDVNMARAHKRDAVLEEKFYFRRHVVDESTGGESSSGGSSASGSDDDELMVELKAAEILSGCPRTGFRGLVHYIHEYLDSVDMAPAVREKVNKYIDLVEGRASGKYMTTAAWLRKFVRDHPAYKHDSIVSEKIQYDMVKTTMDISRGHLAPVELLGDLVNVE